MSDINERGYLLEAVVLKMLETEPDNQYQLTKRIHKQIGVLLANGTIRECLRRMEKENWVAPCVGCFPKGAHHYAITDTGKAILEERSKRINAIMTTLLTKAKEHGEIRL